MLINNFSNSCFYWMITVNSTHMKKSFFPTIQRTKTCCTVETMQHFNIHTTTFTFQLITLRKLLQCLFRCHWHSPQQELL